jgi:hypothetical protein
MSEKMHWKEVSVDRYTEMLEILPPALYLLHGFLVGEPTRHNSDGAPMFMPFLELEGKFYEGSGSLTKAEFRALKLKEVVA